MANSTPNTLLRELLQQQQEPFILQAYLLERGYILKKPEATKFFNLQRSKKGVPYSSNLLKSVYNRLVLITKRLRINNCDDKDGEGVCVPEMNTNNKQLVGDQSQRFSSSASPQEEASSTSLHDHDQDQDLNPSKDEAPADTKLPRRRMKKNNKHCSDTSNQASGSPVPNNKNASVPKLLKTKKVTEDGILSASLWELLVCSTAEKSDLRELVKAKRVLLQNKQLLFDCVREMIDSHTRKGSKSAPFLGTEEVGKLICKKIKEWGRKSGGETNIDQLLNMDYQDSVDEWSDFKPQKRDFAIAIGDGIMEQLENELVADMIDSLA